MHPAFGPRTFYRTRSSPGRSSRSTTSTTTNSSFLRPEVHQSLPRRPSKRPRKRSTGRRTSSARAGSRQRQRRRRRSGVSAARRRRARTITCARSSRPAWASSPCPSSRHSFSMGGIRWTSAFSCTAGTSSPPSLKYSRPSSSGRCSAASRHRVGPLCSCYLIFAFFALFRAWRWPGEVAGRLRGLSLVWLAALVLYSTYAEWWGGRVFGSRFLDDLAPILFVAIAWGTSVGMLGSRFARTVFGLLAAWSFVLFQAAAFLYDKAWDTVPVNVNDDPSRLFNWSDPQWLAVLRLVPSADERVLAGAVLSALVLVLLVRLELRAYRGSELASQV